MFFNLSIATANLFAEELMTDRHVKRIVKSLECSRVGVDVLKNTKIQDALSRHAHDVKLGERVCDLLFRLAMIEEGRADARNDHVESVRGWASRAKVAKKQKKMEIKLVKVTISKVSPKTTQDNRKTRSTFGSTKKTLKIKSAELNLLSLKEAFQKLGI